MSVGRGDERAIGEQLDGIARVVLPELLRRGKHAEAAAMLEALGSGGHETGAAETVEALTDSFHRSLAAEENVERLLDALSDEKLDKEGRDSVVDLLSISGGAAIAGLQEVYAAADSLYIRAGAFEVMRRIGTAALVPFLGALSKIESEWSAIHHVLAALEGQPDPALADAIKPFLRHENAYVRQAALKRMFELLGPDSERWLVAALADSDAMTRLAAVTYLAILQSRDPKLLAFYAGALLPDDMAQSEATEPDEVLVEICRSFAGVRDASFPNGSDAEQFNPLAA